MSHKLDRVRARNGQIFRDGKLIPKEVSEETQSDEPASEVVEETEDRLTTAMRKLNRPV